MLRNAPSPPDCTLRPCRASLWNLPPPRPKALEPCGTLGPVCTGRLFSGTFFTHPEAGAREQQGISGSSCPGAGGVSDDGLNPADRVAPCRTTKPDVAMGAIKRRFPPAQDTG